MGFVENVNERRPQIGLHGKDGQESMKANLATTAVQEASSAYPRPLTTRITLQVPARTDYDLIVRCESCASAARLTSSQGPGVTEVVDVTRNDTPADDSFWLLLEIRQFSGTACDAWQLTINGHTEAGQRALTCG